MSTSWKPSRSAPVNAASWRGDFVRGQKATATEPASTRPISGSWTRCRSGTPSARYWPQPQIENGDSRPSCQPNVRFQKMRAASIGLGSSSRIANDASVAATKPATKIETARGRRSPSGYDAQSGTTSSGANFVHAASAVNAPRAKLEDASQKPQTRKRGGSASFVFELDTYCVNGYAAQAKGRTVASRRPPNRRPTSASPSITRRSTAIDVKCAAGSSSHFPLQLSRAYPGT